MNSSTTSICNLRIFNNNTSDIGPAICTRDRGFGPLNVITQGTLGYNGPQVYNQYAIELCL